MKTEAETKVKQPQAKVTLTDTPHQKRQEARNAVSLRGSEGAQPAHTLISIQ